MDNSPKYLSFSSPKGGVGRTLTLCNCAMIYANGCDWAGIDKSLVLLADLDFNAPGIHYYDFFGTAEMNHNKYNTSRQQNISRDSMLAEMEQHSTGLLFLLTNIMNSSIYKEKIAEINEALQQKNKPEAEIYQGLNVFLFDFLKQEEYSPLPHLIKVGNDKSSIYLLPAASPSHPDFNAHVFRFDWLHFADMAFGLLLLDCIMFEVINHISSLEPGERPVRILIDQQAGMSVPSALNRSLSDAGIFVSGLNRQNKNGLGSLVSNYLSTYEKTPWIVLNQYNFRKLALQYHFERHDNTPHEIFKATDDSERKAFIKRLCANHPELQKNIFVTEFIQDAVQKEHFYDDRGLAVNVLTQLLVSVERSFQEEHTPVNNISARCTLVFAGERIWLNDHYSGPFKGVYSLLQQFFPKGTRIIGLAMKHEDIVRLAETTKLPGHFTKPGLPDQRVTPGTWEDGIYDFNYDPDSETELALNQLDFISYPYYIKKELEKRQQIKIFSLKEFVQPQVVTDSLKGTSARYFQENILRWQEYAEEEPGFVQGVPLFVNFQLLAYRKDFITDSYNFRYRRFIHRNFEGFRSPQDIRDFTCLNKNDHIPNNHLLLCSNDENIAMWYEWQTIFSMFYDGMGKTPYHTTVEDYRKFLLTDEALDATLIYIELLQQAHLTEDNGNTDQNSTTGLYDWDKLIHDFYIDKQSGLIFVWPDSIPHRNQDGDISSRHVIYQVPPSFHLFEECWLLSVVNKTEPDEVTEGKAGFLNYFLTPAVQEYYTHMGGLPIHKSVLSSLDIWSKYAFIPPIWSVYNDVEADRILNKRECFEGNFEAGKAIARGLKTAFHTKGLDKKMLKRILETGFDIIH